MALDIAAVTVTGTSYRPVPPSPDPPRLPTAGARRALAAGRGDSRASTSTGIRRPACAEWYRALAELGESPDAGLPRDLWQVSVDLAGVADLRSAAALRPLRLHEAVPDRAQWPAFQAAGGALGPAAMARRLRPRPGNEEDARMRSPGRR